MTRVCQDRFHHGLLGEGDETGLPMAERALTEMRDMVSQQTRHNLIGGISSGGL